MKLEVRLDAERVAPGEALTGDVLVHEGGRSRELTLTVRFCERSPGYLITAFERGGVLHEGDLPAGHAVPFTYDLPPEALPSVKSEHGELFWELEAVSDEPGFDTRVRRQFEVAPAPRG